MGIFSKPKFTSEKKREVPEGLWQKCPSCGEVIHNLELVQNLLVCPKCDHHFTLSAYDRIHQLVDPDSFTEHDAGLFSVDTLKFTGMASYADRVADLPFDQHFLKALIAPRALLTTEALDDAWANPAGSQVTHLAAQEVYALLGVPERIALDTRPGGHDHSLADWHTLLDFCDSIFSGQARPRGLDVTPLPDLP